MKLADWKPPSLFSSRDSQERDKFLHDSLVSSFVLSEQLKSWSSSYDARARLCVMKFHKEWQHPDCPVMKWYELQGLTDFTVIQHWRNIDTQFYHEFLITEFTDGSACRVERMGEGSRVDALRYTGCAAFDLIQWFSPKDHAARKWSRGSEELIIQVEFPASFDLLDMLAICYTIQHRSPRASVYTLQRYNCYFLCNTILVVLARRVAQWETLITDADWPPLVSSMINELKQKSLLPVAQQQPTDFLALGLCSLLHAESPNPAGFLLEPLQLDLEQRGLKSVNEELAKTLWDQFIDTAIDYGLALCYENLIRTVLDDPDRNSAAFKLHALLKEVDHENFPPIGLDLPSIQNKMVKELLAMGSRAVKFGLTEAKWQLQMRALENKPPLSRRLTGSVAGLLAAAIPTALIAYIFKKTYEPDNDEIDHLCGRFGVTFGEIAPIISPTLRSEIVKLLILVPDLDTLDVDGFDAQKLNDDLGIALADDGAARLFQVMLTILRPDSRGYYVPATLTFLNTYFPKSCWDFCFRFCLTRLRKDEHRSLLACKAASLLIHQLQRNGTQALKTVSTVANFQAYIQQRIHKHAARVQSFQLAAAPLVQQDIERSMTDVWNSLPAGFGANEVE